MIATPPSKIGKLTEKEIDSVNSLEARGKLGGLPISEVLLQHWRFLLFKHLGMQENFPGFRFKLKYRKISITSFFLSILVSATCSANSLWDISGKRISFTSSSPIIVLFSFPVGVFPRFSQIVSAQRFTAWKTFTSLISRVSLFNMETRRLLSSWIASEADSRTFAVSVSITFQQTLFKWTSSIFSINGNTSKTFSALMFSSKKLLHRSASDGIMYFLAK